MYPEMTGKMILAKEPADANHPCSVPCGLLPTTTQATSQGIVGRTFTVLQAFRLCA